MSNRDRICPTITVVFRALCVLLSLAMAQTAGAQVISTIAGIGEDRYSGDNGPALLAGIAPYDIALDRWGNLYIAEPTHRVVRRIDHESGIITTFAGNGQQGNSGDGGPATQASLDYPVGVGVDRKGNVFVADFYTGVRRVDRKTGIITTVAGPSIPDVPDRGDGGPATHATLLATDVIVNREGDLYIGDDFRIRRVDHETGIITTVVGDGHFALFSGSGEGGPARSAGFIYILTTAFGPHGELYIVDPGLANVRRVDRRTDIITTVAGEHLAFFPEGSIPAGYNGDGIPATDALLNVPTNIAFDCTGNLTISDTFNFRVRQVNRRTGIITTIAGNGQNSYSGDGGLATQAGINRPRGLAFGSNGDLFFAEEDGRIRKVSGLAPQAGDGRCKEHGREDCDADDDGNCERTNDHHADTSPED